MLEQKKKYKKYLLKEKYRIKETGKTKSKKEKAFKKNKIYIISSNYIQFKYNIYFFKYISSFYSSS